MHDAVEGEARLGAGSGTHGDEPAGAGDSAARRRAPEAQGDGELHVAPRLRRLLRGGEEDRGGERGELHRTKPVIGIRISSHPMFPPGTPHLNARTALNVPAGIVSFTMTSRTVTRPGSFSVALRIRFSLIRASTSRASPPR